MMRLVPGDIVDTMMFMGSEGGYPDVEVARQAIEHRLGLDVSIPVQYGRWMGVIPQEDGSFRGVLQGNLGNSLWKGTPVKEEILNCWLVTLELGLLGLIIAQLIALPIGIYSALRQDTWGDYLGRSFAILCIAVPGFWLGTMVIVLPAVWWDYMPSITLIRFTEDPIGNLKMFVMPAIVLGMALSGLTMRMTRTMMLEVLRQDYIRTAWAKGLRERTMVMRHALKNALIPIITVVGLQMPILVGGTVIVEQIFCLPGMGRLILSSIQSRDYTIVSGTVLVFSVALAFINLIVDLAYGYLDPRIQYK